jgi:hypothetical protein
MEVKSGEWLIAAASDMSWPQLDYRRTIPKT